MSCQTSALCTGWPVARSHSSVVSRWLVMPTAARSRGGQVRLAQRLGDDGERVVEHLDRIVLDPAGLRIDLPVLALRRGDGVAGTVEHDEAAAGGALVDGADVSGHVSPGCFRARGSLHQPGGKIAPLHTSPLPLRGAGEGSNGVFPRSTPAPPAPSLKGRGTYAAAVTLPVRRPRGGAGRPWPGRSSSRCGR